MTSDDPRPADHAASQSDSDGQAAGVSTSQRHADDDGTETASSRRAVRGTLLLVAVVGALVVVGIVAVAVLRSDGSSGGVTADRPPLLGQAGAAVGKPVPATVLPPLGDLGPRGGLDLPAPGEPMVINFWASWCAPCVSEMPMLQRVADDTGVAMVGVDFIDQPDKAIELAQELDITYTLVRDDDGEFGQLVGLLGTPTTLLVDAQGVVQRQLTGELTERQLREAIAGAF